MSLRRCLSVLVLALAAEHATCEWRSVQGLRPGPGAIIPPPKTFEPLVDNVNDQLSEFRGSKDLSGLMLQLMQRVAIQEQQQEQEREQREQEREQREQIIHQLETQRLQQEQGGEESNPGQPEEALSSLQEVSNDKRGSYMSLCHFKICNMGRKRNLRRTTWARN